MISLSARHIRIIPFAFSLLCLALAACGGGGSGSPPQSVSGVAASGQAQLKDAIALLNKGQPEAARKILIHLLKHQPGDMVARSLISQIDTPAEILLGAKSFAYESREGDSFSSLADRYLGNPMLAYALSRYNSVDVPEGLAAGRVLRIPGNAPRERIQKTERPEISRSPEKVSPKPAITHATKSVVSSSKAATLRARGLEQLNRGAINTAVGLLAQANQLDPNSVLITRDLARARRIQKTVQTK